MDRFLDCDSAEKTQVCRVIVQHARDVSNEIAKKTGVRHESPQVLMIRDGKCVWNTSHRNITSEALIDAVENR